MPLLSVLTAAIGEWAEYVTEAGHSVAGQELPAGWQVEWIIQEDGPEPALAELAAHFPFARYAANGERLGVAVTRNLGLTRVAGTLVHVLDCDDLLLPGGLGAVLRAFDTHPRIHWVAAQADNLLPDGTREAFEPASPTGYVEAGAVGDFILANGRAPFLPNGATLRTATARALGGWAAVPTDDETALLVAISELAPGYYTPEVTWLYRQHDRQTSRRPDWRARLPVSWDVVKQRIRAQRAAGLTIAAS